MSLFSIGQTPSPRAQLILPCVMFVIVIAGYITASEIRHASNPDDKVLPTIGKMAETSWALATEPDRKGDVRLWVDTVATGKRFLLGFASLFVAAIIGVNMGVFIYVRLLLGRFILFFEKFPALALLPMFFIVFHGGELTKFALLVVGCTPVIVMDTMLRAQAVQKEQIIKGQTMNASTYEICYRIVLPQIFPQVLDTIRINFKMLMIFLIAAEMLGASAGLGYRIFVVQRLMRMDIIIPYVIWMGILMLLMDYLVRRFITWKFKWLKVE